MLDLDNTLFDIKPLILAAFTNKFEYKAPTTYDITQCYPKEISDIITKIFRSDALYYTPLFNNEYIQIVNYLQQHYKVLYITSRSSLKKTYQQLKQNKINVGINDIILSKDPTKLTEIKKNHVDFVVDDNPAVITACLKNNIDHLMVSTKEMPYNHYLRSTAKWDTTLESLIHRIHNNKRSK